jgi:hypothetical protein
MCTAAVTGSIAGGKHYTHFLVDNGEVWACGRYGSNAMTFLAQVAQAQHSFRHICGHNLTSRTKPGFQAVPQTVSTFEDAPTAVFKSLDTFVEPFRSLILLMIVVACASANFNSLRQSVEQALKPTSRAMSCCLSRLEKNI